MILQKTYLLEKLSFLFVKEKENKSDEYFFTLVFQLKKSLLRL